MSNSAPFNLVGVPFTAYTAPVGTAFPSVWTVTPAVDWIKLGTNGALDYGEDGVTLNLSQSIAKWRGLGHPGPRKSFRTEEDLIVSLTLADMSLEQLKVVLNGNAITTVAPGGDPGTKSIGLSRGLGVSTFALLLRANDGSPYGDFAAQYEFPLAQQTGSPQPVLGRKGPAIFNVEFSMLVDPDASGEDTRFGRLRVVHLAEIS
jgi:hypothetical protein